MKRYLSALVATAACCLFPAVASAQFPERTVTLVVPYAAGGPLDVFARGLSQQLATQWGVSVIVENKAGANEIIAAQYVTRAKPDGYTLLVGSDPVISQNQFLYKRLPYDPEKSLVPISRVARINMALFTPAKFPATDLKEFVSYVKSQPGKVVYGSAGMGNITHLAMAWLEKQQDLSMTHVPYKGLSPAMQDMLGGRVDAAFAAVSFIEPYVKSGDIKALALSGSSRAKALPDVPTFAEQGFEDVDANLTVGILGPQGVPEAIIQRITESVQTALKDKEFVERYIETVALEPIPDTHEQFVAYVKTDRDRQKARIDASGAQLD